MLSYINRTTLRGITGRRYSPRSTFKKEATIVRSAGDRGLLDLREQKCTVMLELREQKCTIKRSLTKASRTIIRYYAT